ncbi:MAG: 3-isopropylmalate dehydrogenase [Cyclobacteriaceae bacterium]|nr:3-isopropylmalate dehydrogenase [Cyclobacteriaceae bacterium]UYN86323.1 MAG: 3-isopropylmalate dehydrogenase [Cyclobacteriaceae bacterium]
MKKRITIIPGDGIGKEVTTEGKNVLQHIAESSGHEFIFTEALIGHDAIEKTGTALPDETLAMLKNSDAILFGAVGHPKYDNDPTLKVRPEQGLLKMRKELGLYANLRPIKLFDELLHASSIKPEILKGSDILFFRELTGDVYFGEKGRRDENNTAYDLMIYHRYEIERIAHKAFQAARTRRKKVTSVDKANVLESSRLWREVVQQVGKEYPDITLEHQFIDAAAMKLIQSPRSFDVVLTGNLFGDILTDEASQIAGSMGMLASASVGDTVGLYEPIHGSAHDITGKGIANPLASILSAALLLDISFGLKEESEAVIQAVEQTLKAGYRTADIADSTTPKEKILNTGNMGKKVVDQLTVTLSNKLRTNNYQLPTK